jgi:SSS family solute:Na+ symporter
MTLTVILLALYSILQIAIGLWIGRAVRGTADFFVAGRRLGAGLLFSTVLAANVGAGSTQGAAGLGYRDGLSAWWWVGSAGLGSMILAFWIGPAMRRVAAKHDLKTVGDYLEMRYSRDIRGVVSSVLWLGTLSILSGQLIALGGVVHVVTGFPTWAGVLIGGAVMATYFTAGGLLTSAWVNLVQLVVLLVGFVVVLALATADVGGLDVLRARTAAIPGYWSFSEGGASGWRYLFLLGPAFFVSPGLLQKIYGARDDRAVRLGVAANGAVLLLFAFMPPLLGMLARVHHPALPNPELALPTLLTADLPPSVGILGLAALVSAEISTCDAILFMLATSLSQDLYKRFVRPTATDREVLEVARTAAIAGAAGGILLALVTPSITAALGIFYSLLTVSLFVPVVAGLFVTGFRTLDAAIAIGAGVATLLVTHLITGGAAVAGWTPTMLGLAVSIAAAACTFTTRRMTEVTA